MPVGLVKTAYQPPIRFLRWAWAIELCGEAIRWRRTISPCPALIAVIYAATGIGYVSRRTLEMKMLASNFAGLRPGFPTEQLATSIVVVHGGPVINRSNVG